MQLSLAPTAAAPARARAAVTAWLGRQSRDDVLIEIALLLVSELVTNSVRHARLEAETTLRLNASLGATALRIELCDDGTGGTVARRPPQRDEDAGGYGLDLVATALQRLGRRPRRRWHDGLARAAGPVRRDRLNPDLRRVRPRGCGHPSRRGTR